MNVFFNYYYEYIEVLNTMDFCSTQDWVGRWDKEGPRHPVLVPFTQMHQHGEQGFLAGTHGHSLMDVSNLTLVTPHLSISFLVTHRLCPSRLKGIR